MARRKSLDEQIAAKPDDPKLWKKRGDARFGLEEYDAAAADYRGAIALDPAHPALHFNLGQALAAAGKQDAALAAFDQAIALAGDHVDARLSRALVLLGLRQYDRAVAEAEALSRCALPDESREAVGELLASARAEQRLAARGAVEVTTGEREPLGETPDGEDDGAARDR